MKMGLGVFKKCVSKELCIINESRKYVHLDKLCVVHVESRINQDKRRNYCKRYVEVICWAVRIRIIKVDRSNI